MFDMVKRFFSRAESGGGGRNQPQSGNDTHVAACALFLAMAQIDESASAEEMDTIRSILNAKYGLSPEDAEALMAEARQELAASIDYWEFARTINDNYATDEKLEIIESLWQIVFADDHMNRYEHYLMHKLSTILRLSHDQLIDAKLKVRNATSA